MGAVVIIGLFYGEALAPTPLLLVGLALLNRFGIVRPTAYVTVDLVPWVAMLKSGLEAALAGFIVALAGPLHMSGRPCSSSLRKVESRPHPWCALFIIPLFAFFCSGVVMDAAAVAGALVIHLTTRQSRCIAKRQIS